MTCASVTGRVRASAAGRAVPRGHQPVTGLLRIEAIGRAFRLCISEGESPGFSRSTLISFAKLVR